MLIYCSYLRYLCIVSFVSVNISKLLFYCSLGHLFARRACRKQPKYHAKTLALISLPSSYSSSLLQGGTWPCSKGTRLCFASAWPTARAGAFVPAVVAAAGRDSGRGVGAGARRCACLCLKGAAARLMVTAGARRAFWPRTLSCHN